MKRYFLIVVLCISGVVSCAQDIPSLLSRAEQGDASAQFALCLCYVKGRGVEADKTKALSYLIQAAENDYPEAIYELGCCYKDGALGLPVWREKAKDCFFRASELGYSDAKKELERLTKDYRFVRRGVRRTVYNQTVSIAPQSKAVEYSNKKERLVSN